ncbi:hypothetical protein D3C71_1905030 [compost metagenome]
MAGNAEHHKKKCVRQLVAIGSGASHPTQLIHQVKEEEQGQKAGGDKGDGEQGFAVYQAADGFHAGLLGGRAALARQRLATVHWLCRAASTSSDINSMPPCSITMKLTSPSRPAPTQLCPRVMRL